MNLKQHIHQKRRNPLILAITITLTLILAVVIVKNLHSPGAKQQNQVQLIITTDFVQLPDSAFPVLLVSNKLIIHAFTSCIPKDSSFMLHISQGPHSFKLIDKSYHVISKDSFFYKKEEVVFINFKPKL